VSEVTHQCSYNRFLHVVIIINFLVCKNEMRLVLRLQQKAVRAIFKSAQ